MVGLPLPDGPQSLCRADSVRGIVLETVRDTLTIIRTMVIRWQRSQRNIGCSISDCRDATLSGRMVEEMVQRLGCPWFSNGMYMCST